MRFCVSFFAFIGPVLLNGCGPSVSSMSIAERGIERLDIVAEDGSTALSYFRAGEPDGRRLIFVHGTPGDATNYLDYLADPPAGWEVISVDRPGFGRSSADGKRSLTFAGQAEALTPLLVERDGRWPVLVGHSLGGPIVLRSAADRPHRVGGVVVLAGSVDPALERPRWYNVVGAVPPVSWLLPGPMRRANDEIFAAPAETQALADVLDRVTCPVVIVQGQEDVLVPAANADYLLDSLPNAKRVNLILIPGAGHFLPWEHGPTVRRAIEEAAE